MWMVKSYYYGVEGSDETHSYREWIVERIEGAAGTLVGDARGVFSLDTRSLEQLYEAIFHRWPVTDYNKIKII